MTPPQIPRAHTLGRTRHVSECKHDVGTGPSAPRVGETHLQPQPCQLPAGLCVQPAGPDRTPSSPPPTALFLDRLMKRRQDSGYLIKEIGDVLLARVRAPSPGSRPPLPARGLDARVLGPQPCPPSQLPPPGGAWLFPLPPETPPWPESRCSLMVPRANGSRKSPPASAATSRSL